MNAVGAIGLMACALIVGGSAAGEAAFGPGTPVNTWVLRHKRTPNLIWEMGIAYDPVTHIMVRHGGHVLGTYAQTNYTILYDVRRNTFSWSRAPLRPQRRCLVAVTYVDSCRRALTAHGGSSHGSLPQGAVSGDYKGVHLGDPRGPWLYDVTDDVWEDCRTLPPVWKRAAHSWIVYDSGSDLVASLSGTSLVLFNPRTNRVIVKPLPKALGSRLGHGLAADPVNRKLVLFGGSRDGGWVWVRGDRAKAYREMVQKDTWLYDVVTGEWSRVTPKAVPPRGTPMNDHVSIPMVYHPPSGTILMLQNDLDEWKPDNRTWPSPKLWSFDVTAGEWTEVPTRTPPAFTGIMCYASHEDVVILRGGGRDGKAGGDRVRPALSRYLWTIRVKVPGKTPVSPRDPERVTAVTTKDGVQLTWTGFKAAYDVFRAPADPFPGRYEKIATIGNTAYVDRDAKRGQVYAYQVTRTQSLRRSIPAFNQPWRPSGLRASVETPTKVVLRWRKNTEPDVAGYHVYRARGAEIEKGKGARLTAKLIAATTFADTDVDLSDGVGRIYCVTAVNKGGIESGASPLAYTFPDAVERLTAEVLKREGDEREVRVAWTWPKGVNVAGFNVYHATEHVNGTGGERFRKLWTRRTEKPVKGTEVILHLRGGVTEHDYFYVRAVNVLGQEGFCTDLVSPTDQRFRPQI